MNEWNIEFLREIREMRRESNSNFDKVNERLQFLEKCHAQSEGEKKANMRFSAMASGLISLIISGFISFWTGK